MSRNERAKAQRCAWRQPVSYGEGVAEYLYSQGYTISVVNPARIKAYAASQLQRNKTDKLDAALIADFCRTQQSPLWMPPDPLGANCGTWCATWTIWKATASAKPSICTPCSTVPPPSRAVSADLAATGGTAWAADRACEGATSKPH